MQGQQNIKIQYCLDVRINQYIQPSNDNLMLSNFLQRINKKHIYRHFLRVEK